MKTKLNLVLKLAVALTLTGATLAMAQQTGAGSNVPQPNPKGPCDIYAAAGDSCVAAYSTTRAMYASYDGPLYQVKRQSDGKTLNIGVVRTAAKAGGYANAAAQDAFCANTYCWITTIYDQSSKHNDLTQAPRGNFSGPAMGGLNNVPIADMAPVMVMGHKVYGAFIEPGMGLRNDDPKGTAVDDQAEGQYWVVNGKHFNSGCCFDFGNAEIDSHDDDAGTMETAYFGNAPWWYHGTPPGPWVMTDQENNLVGCSNPDGSKACDLPSIDWRFVTGMAKGEPHHWTSMGGDAQSGALSVMFSGPRVNSLYDPMRKQGAILLGNGGDNSESSQGTFYEGAMTAAGTFPTDATDQLVQANIVAAGYRELPLSLAPASAKATPPGLQTFSPRSSQATTVTFTNTTGAPAKGVTLSLSVPNRQWSSVVAGTRKTSMTFAHPVAPGASVSATFKVTSGPAAFNGDLAGHASWTNQKSGQKQSETLTEKVRNVSPIKINEFRISTNTPANSTDSFIELHNSGARSVDISNWTLTEHAEHQALFSTVKIPAGKKLAPGGSYLLGLSNSGLAVPARAGDAAIDVRSTDGMKAGDTISIGSGANLETRKIASVGTAAGDNTTLWQPLPDGFITIPAGSTNVPVMSVAGFKVGEKIALGYGATYPTDPAGRERYEVATVTAVGKPGSQDYLAADAPAGSTNIKVTSVEDISVGDKIRLDIDSVGHGIETVTVTKVGRPASRAKLMEDVSAGATTLKVFMFRGPQFTVGDTMRIGTPATWKTVTISAVSAQGKAAVVSFTPALTQSYTRSSDVVDVGTGLDLAAPLRLNHSANLPFADRGTGISFQPATAFAHMSDEPVQPLGTGLTLDRALANNHAIDAVVRDATVTTAGYQGTPAPSQWFGGPALASSAGSMVLRNAAGLVVDSLNYGGLVDPWAAEGYQAASGFGASGCYVETPGSATGAGVSAGRSPDGADTDSNCADFVTTPVTTLAAAAAAGATNIKVDNVNGFGPGQTIRIDSGANLESAAIAKVGSPGATTLRDATAAGVTILPVVNARGLHPGQALTIGSGAHREMAVIVTFTWWRGATITIAAPLKFAHAAGAQVSGTGITLTTPLTRAHANAAPLAGGVATPGATNHYYRKPR